MYKANINRYKGRNYNNTIILEYSIPFTSMDRSSIQKISKARVVLNDTIDGLDLVDICRTFHPNTEE